MKLAVAALVLTTAVGAAADEPRPSSCVIAAGQAGPGQGRTRASSLLRARPRQPVREADVVSMEKGRRRRSARSGSANGRSAWVRSSSTRDEHRTTAAPGRHRSLVEHDRRIQRHLHPRWRHDRGRRSDSVGAGRHERRRGDRARARTQRAFPSTCSVRRRKPSTRTRRAPSARRGASSSTPAATASSSPGRRRVPTTQSILRALRLRARRRQRLRTGLGLRECARGVPAARPGRDRARARPAQSPD